MSKLAVDYLFKNTALTSNYPTAYNKDAIGLGDRITKYTGANPQDNYCAPQSGIMRPMESNPTNIPVMYPHVVQWSTNIYHVFLADAAAAALTRRIVMAEYNKTTGGLSWKGFVTLSPVATGTHTIKGHRMLLDRYTTGTVNTSATAVAGIGTTWLTDRVGVGGRIGFGSTDHTQITTWYQITITGGEGSITIGASAPTLTGVPYVIELYTHVMVTTNTTNGGLFVTKGLNADLFIPAGTPISFAVSTDLLRAVYWLKDAGVLTNVTAGGVCLDTKVSATSQDAYVVEATAPPKIFKYNVRAALTVASGASTAGWVLTTGTEVVIGATSGTNNGRLATLNHGPAIGVKTLFFVTVSRVYRVPVSGITSGSVTWIAGSMGEIPAGGTNSMAASSALSSLEVADSIDRLLIFAGAIQRSYLTKYVETGDAFERDIFINSNQLDQSSLDSQFFPYPNICGAGNVVFSAWSEGGMLFLCRGGLTATTNVLYLLAGECDYAYASVGKNYLVSPRIATPNAKKLSRVYVNSVLYLGGDINGPSPEPYKVYVRTAGIDDDSGTWVQVGADGDISGMAPGAYIQVAISFRIFGYTCIPARIVGFGVTYEDTSSLSNYQFSATLSVAASKQFAWRFSTAFGTTVPTLQIQLYDAQTGGSLLTDSTVAPTGTWEKSTNSGGAWSAYDATDLANTTTYIRYTPASLADNIVIRPVLTLA